MHYRAGWRAGVVALALAGSAVPAAAQLGKDDVEAIVRELLVREPGLVIEAIEAYRAEQEVARQAATLVALESHAAALTDASHPSVGPSDAAVTLVEFFDYRCTFCRRMAPTVAGLMQDNTDVRRVFVEFPVLGPESLRASQAALAVWAQDPAAYPRFHEALMVSDDLSAPALTKLAEELGLDADRLVSDMQSSEVRARLQKNYELATAIGIEGTPAYVVGGHLLPGAVPLEQLQSAIDAAREG